MDETSQPIDLLLSVTRDGPQTLGAQIEDQLRRGVREGSFHPGARLPSTRDLARQLGVSRRVVVDAYAQLAAEGYLALRQGAQPRITESPAAAHGERAEAPQPQPRIRFDFRPSVPDVSTFPRAAWLRSIRHALASMTDAELGYGDVCGADVLRSVLAEYLGRVRGVVAEPARVVVTSGYSQGLGVVCHALAASGAKRLALEDPTDPDQAAIAARAGLEPVWIPVDEAGIRVDELARADADAVIVTPAHQHPNGVVLAPERRTALVAWLRERGAIAVEDDYDAEYRYDRAAVGAFQGLEPDHIVYAGTASKTLAPALRLGWLVVPAGMLEGVRREKTLADRGTARIEQHAFADFLARGELDRHLRRMRARYRGQRDAIIQALADELPDATVRGVAAGLHVSVELLDGDDERTIREEAERRRIALEITGDYTPDAGGRPATLMLGYAQIPEASIRAGVREVAAAVRAARESSAD